MASVESKSNVVAASMETKKNPRLIHQSLRPTDAKSSFILKEHLACPTTDVARQKSPSMILSNPPLYIGSLVDVNSDFVERENVSLVVSALSSELTREREKVEACEYHRIVIDDVGSAMIASHLPALFKLLDEARSRNKTILVHCKEGVSRSATLVAAYLAYLTDWDEDLSNILLYIQQRRRIMNPNAGFRGQLKDIVQEQQKLKAFSDDSLDLQ
jgi:protein-tyrosine phosphatase